jgi:hypothetical protein
MLHVSVAPLRAVTLQSLVPVQGLGTKPQLPKAVTSDTTSIVSNTGVSLRYKFVKGDKSPI